MDCINTPSPTCYPRSAASTQLRQDEAEKKVGDGVREHWNRTQKRSDRAWRWEWRQVYPTWCSGIASPSDGTYPSTRTKCSFQWMTEHWKMQP